MIAPQDLKELLRSKGKTQSEAGVTQVYASLISNGHRRAGSEAIKKIADALVCSTEVVFAACDESYRRANLAPALKPDLSAGLTALGDLAAVDHRTAAPTAQGA